MSHSLLFTALLLQVIGVNTLASVDTLKAAHELLAFSGAVIPIIQAALISSRQYDAYLSGDNIRSLIRIYYTCVVCCIHCIHECHGMILALV